MKLILKNTFNEFIKSISINDFETYERIIEQISPLQKPVKASLITANEEINAFELSQLRSVLETLNITLIDIYSENRETILSGKSLKITSKLLNKKVHKNELFANAFVKRNDILHKGTVRSGNRISSNGDLFIIGDVNPGAIVCANNNVYVWGKLLGIALAGEDGNKKALIASLYLNPLQLRICDIVAIGPKEKPTHKYPEVAVLEENTIVIKPYLIST